MSQIDTPEQAASVRAAGEAALERQDWSTAYEALFGLHESSHVTGEDQGDIAFLVGEACLGLESYDAAHHYYELAQQSGSSYYQGRAQERLAEITRYDDAIDAAGDGVAGDTEAGQILAAADDALARGDHDGAHALYTQAYEGSGYEAGVDTRAALGLARCLAAQGDHTTAGQYAAYAEQSGEESVRDGAAAVIRQVGEVGEGELALADGVTATEVHEMFGAGAASYGAGDHEGALRSFVAGYESPQASGMVRATLAFNIAQALIKLERAGEARPYVEEATSGGYPSVQRVASELLTYLDDRDAALALVTDEAVAIDGS